ncbi:hypothetical protein CLV33_102221 [Jejuia pallidilutea]|uniref:Uncharacterized protein n=2 Tax=Jejuia pallidilutea TaxID=504487 RepID=A0A362XER9_9FLAO|nr:hypothetical protein [Jejuia pallidilutea]PQV50360.1 hypothetical protein CLV33_102221 [Jejuia pallidilutea]
MKEETIKTLMEKYEAGNSTLEEEQILFKNSNTSTPKLKALGAFKKAHKKAPPKDFNDRLWTSFEGKTSRKRRFSVVMLSAAASVVVLIMIAIYSLQPKTLSYAEKQALLDEALSMFPETEQIQRAQHILYEDDLVIVYTSPE